MRHSRTIFAALICTILFASACVTDIEYNGPDSKSKLVVNCIVQDGKAPLFHISRSRSFLEYYLSNEDLKTGVDVEISINDQVKKASYNEELNAYTDGRIVGQGDVISVTAVHELYGSVTSTDTVPYSQQCYLNSHIQKYVHKQTISEAFDDYYTSFNDENVDSLWVVQLDFQDNPNSDDFYFLQIEPIMSYTQKWSYYNIVDTVNQYLHFKVPAATKIILEQSDPSTALLEETEEDSQFELGTALYVFTDQYIKDGGKVTFEVLIEKPDTAHYIFTGDYDIYDVSYLNPDDYTVTYGNRIDYRFKAKLYVVSRSYYLYHKSVKDYDDADMSFLSEPVTIISNIKGGIGILGSYAVKESYIGFTRPF